LTIHGLVLVAVRVVLRANKQSLNTLMIQTVLEIGLLAFCLSCVCGLLQNSCCAQFSRNVAILTSMCSKRVDAYNKLIIKEEFVHEVG